MPNNPGTSVQLGGLFDRIIEGGPTRSAPMSFTVELWFKTTQSGKLIGFESTRDLVSSRFDRTVHIDASGRVVYGAWTPETTKIVRTPRSYADGAWHHLAVGVSSTSTSSSARIYVDGLKVAEGPATVPSSYAGWWRVGFGTMPNRADVPIATLNGQLDTVAVFDHEVSPGRINVHYSRR